MLALPLQQRAGWQTERRQLLPAHCVRVVAQQQQQQVLEGARQLHRHCEGWRISPLRRVSL